MASDAGLEERRRVAEALRAKARDELGADSLVRALKVILGLDLGRHVGWRQVFERLADLIDPTTTVDFQAPWQVCRKCGARFAGYQFKPVRCCPHCGRRIVRGEEP